MNDSNKTALNEINLKGKNYQSTLLLQMQNKKQNQRSHRLVSDLSNGLQLNINITKIQRLNDVYGSIDTC